MPATQTAATIERPTMKTLTNVETLLARIEAARTVCDREWEAGAGEGNKSLLTNDGPLCLERGQGHYDRATAALQRAEALTRELRAASGPGLLREASGRPIP